LDVPWQGILLEGVSVETAGIALGVAGYGLATRSSDRAGQILGVATVVLCAVSMAIPSFDLPGLFLES
jgi:drug/metabolite transporter (DMT)-like permease